MPPTSRISRSMSEENMISEPASPGDVSGAAGSASMPPASGTFGLGTSSQPIVIDEDDEEIMAETVQQEQPRQTKRVAPEDEDLRRNEVRFWTSSSRQKSLVVWPALTCVPLPPLLPANG